MILRRLAQSLKEQNWTAIWIEFILLVSGVFLGIQVSNWNADRVDQSRAHAYLERIVSDLNANITAFNDRLSFWGGVSAYGMQGLAYAETGDTKEATQWELLLAYFQASQVAEFYMTDATFEELKSAGELGLIKDTHFRDAIAQYYSFGFNPALTERPPYREHVRGVIPINIQNYIWNNCYSSDSMNTQKMLPCKSPIDEIEAAVIVNTIRNDKTLIAELRYWVSTMHVARLIAHNQIQSASSLKASIDAMNKSVPKENSP